jgi:hypothetical protein
MDFKPKEKYITAFTLAKGTDDVAILPMFHNVGQNIILVPKDKLELVGESKGYWIFGEK